MLKILFVGDICGRIGRQTVAAKIGAIRKKQGIDIVVANADNLAHGKGVTVNTVVEMLSAGVDLLTGGDHAFGQANEIERLYNGQYSLIRPENYSASAPGEGFKSINCAKGRVLIINLLGRVFMKTHPDCPFRAVDRVLTLFDKKNFSAILVDIHAEATSEKLALFHYLDGRVSALLGTHTHVMTADQQITQNGTAYITDVGMTGYSQGVIGIEKSLVIEAFLTQIKYKHQYPEKGRSVLSGAIIGVDEKTGKAVSIRPLVIEYAVA